MEKKNGAFGAGQFSLGTLAGGRPGTTIFQNPGGGGGWGGVAYKDRARPPPRVYGFILQLLEVFLDAVRSFLAAGERMIL